MTLFREIGRQFAPACMHCMTAIWMVFDSMWCTWICTVCGEWVDPYGYPSSLSSSTDAAAPFTGADRG